MTVNCYFTFSTTYFAIRAEELLGRGLFSFKMVPVPRRISSSCGISLRCSCSDAEAIKEIFVQNRVEYQGIHHL